MAYLHCHTKDCGWSQDDFWNFRPRFRWHLYKKSWWKLGFSIGYNPISRTLTDIRWLWKPKWLSLDDWYINDMIKYTGVKVKVRKVEKTINVKSGNVFGKMKTIEQQVFSWQWLLLELVVEWKNIRRMKWRTWKSWKKTRDIAVCPKCGLRNFDID